MRRNTEDKTIARNYVQKYRFLIKEYEKVRRKEHSQFRFVEDFYRFHGTNRQTFLKYYHRFKDGYCDDSLLPQKRGPKWKTRRPLRFIENKVIDLREKGNGRYEIHNILKPILPKSTPSPSGIYNILKRYKLNRMSPKIKKSHQKIIKKRAGEMGHSDCHYLSQGIIWNQKQKLYLVGVIDDCTRIVWVEVIEDVKSLSVMFATLRCLNFIVDQYGIKFEEMLTDNGSEFGRKQNQNKEDHPYERMLLEMRIKHRYTRAYRPQTNGKVERFWRTLEDDLLRETTFESLDHLKDELLQYLFYYNNERPHQGLNGLSPLQFLKNLSTN